MTSYPNVIGGTSPYSAQVAWYECDLPDAESCVPGTYANVLEWAATIPNLNIDQAGTYTGTVYQVSGTQVLPSEVIISGGDAPEPGTWGMLVVAGAVFTSVIRRRFGFGAKHDARSRRGRPSAPREA